MGNRDTQRDDWSKATVQEMVDHLDAIGPPWGNSKLLASWVEEGFWIAYEALSRLGLRALDTRDCQQSRPTSSSASPGEAAEASDG